MFSVGTQSKNDSARFRSDAVVRDFGRRTGSYVSGDCPCRLPDCVLGVFADVERRQVFVTNPFFDPKRETKRPHLPAPSFGGYGRHARLACSAPPHVSVTVIKTTPSSGSPQLDIAAC